MNQYVADAYYHVSCDCCGDNAFTAEFKRLWKKNVFKDIPDELIVTSSGSSVEMTMCELMSEYFRNAPAKDAKEMARNMLNISGFCIDLSVPTKLVRYVENNPDDHVPYAILWGWVKEMPFNFEQLSRASSCLTTSQAVKRIAEMTELDENWIHTMARKMAKKAKKQTGNAPRAFMAFNKGCPDFSDNFQEVAAKVCEVYIVNKLADFLETAQRLRDIKTSAQTVVRNYISSVSADELNTACSWAYIMYGTISGNRRFVKKALMGVIAEDGDCMKFKWLEERKKTAFLQKENEELKKQMDHNDRLAKQREENLQKQITSGNGADGSKLHEVMDALKKEQRKNASLEEKLAEYREFETSISQEEDIPDSLPEVDTSARYMFVMQDPKMKPKLREWFPNSVLSEGKDVTQAYYMVVFITKSISHSEYIRVKRRCDTQNVPYVNCNRISKDAVMEAIAARTARAPFA